VVGASGDTHKFFLRNIRFKHQCLRLFQLSMFVKHEFSSIRAIKEKKRNLIRFKFQQSKVSLDGPAHAGGFKLWRDRRRAQQPLLNDLRLNRCAVTWGRTVPPDPSISNNIYVRLYRQPFDSMCVESLGF
jgi:hypothetical protein